MSTFCWYVAICYAIGTAAFVAAVALQFFRSRT